MHQAQNNEAVEQFMKLLAENGRPGQARDMSFLLLYMANMSRQFDDVLQELQEVKAQLARARESPAKKAVKSMADFLEDQAHSARDTLVRFREKVRDCAASAVEDFKTTGVLALDKAVSAMRVKSMLEYLQKKIGGMIDGTEKNMAKVEDIGHELRSAGSHLKNAGRTAIGREAKSVDRDQPGHFQAAVLLPLRAVRKLLHGMNHATLAAIKGVEHLKVSADIRTERRPSVRQALMENRAELLGLSAPAPERKHNEQERPEEKSRVEGQMEKKPSVRQALAEKKAEAAARPAPVRNKERKAPEAAL